MKLSDMIQREFNLAGFCENTKRNYYISISASKKYFKKSFIEITENDLKNYFSELVEAKKSQSTIKNIYYALSFLFKRVLERDFPLSVCPVGKAEKKLPTVLSLEEIKTILDATTTTKQKAIIAIAYSGGLRISEVSNLKICHIDSKRMMIKVSQGKGRKDRYTILSKITLNHLREYFIQYRPKTLLFYGKDKDSKCSIRSIQYFYSKVKKKIGLRKEVNFHTLRHSFATHLYEGGTGLLHIQRLLGHASLKTTMIYTHLVSQDAVKLKSPLDSLYE